MSSMIKKKGALSFKPRAPRPRSGAAPPSTASSTPTISEQQVESVTPQTRLRSSVPSLPSTTQLQPSETLQPEEDSQPQTERSATLPEHIDPQSQPSHEDSHHEGEHHTRSRKALTKTNHVADASTSGTDIDKSVISEQLPHTSTAIPDTAQPRITDDTQPATQSITAPEPDLATTHEVPDIGTEDLSTMGAGESGVPERGIPLQQLNPDGTSGDGVKVKRSRKRRRVNDDLDVRPSIEVQLDAPQQSSSDPSRPRKPRKRKDGTRRFVTPDDAEDQEIDHSTVKMADLCKDIKIGKRFSRHAEIKQRELERRAKIKLARDHPELVASESALRAGLSQTAEGAEGDAEANVGPRLRIVQGQIVIDDSSLVMDRHKDAAANTAEMEEVEENEFTRVTTAGTYLKRERNVFWDHESNEKFYNALRMFGTDFEMIAMMFPNRSRKQIKLKFNREEKMFPKRVASALLREQVKIDFEEFKSLTGLEYETVDEINAEHAKFDAENLEIQQSQEARLAEATRQKKAAIREDFGPKVPNIEVTPAAGTESAKENEVTNADANEGGKASAASKPRKQPARRKKRNLHSIHGGGEEVEILGTI